MDAELETPETIEAAFSRWRPAGKAESTRDQIEQFAIFVRSAVAEVFGAQVAARPVAFSAWGPREQALLREIAKTPYELHLNAGDLGRRLAAVGAMSLGAGEDDRYLRRYVGLCAPTPLEAEFEGRPLWLWLRLHLMGEVARDEWTECVACLDPEARPEFARRALDNAYQLTRRFPMPGNLSQEVEREDTTHLTRALLPMVASVAPDRAEGAIAAERSARPSSPGLVLLLSLSLAERGAELASEHDDLLADALDLQSHAGIGRQLLELLSPERRESLVRRIRLRPHNISGWIYLDLLTPTAAGEILVSSLREFNRACVPEVAAYLRALLSHVDAAAKRSFGAIASEDGPNAATLKAALGAI